MLGHDQIWLRWVVIVFMIRSGWDALFMDHKLLNFTCGFICRFFSLLRGENCWFCLWIYSLIRNENCIFVPVYFFAASRRKLYILLVYFFRRFAAKPVYFYLYIFSPKKIYRYTCIFFLKKNTAQESPGTTGTCAFLNISAVTRWWDWHVQYRMRVDSLKAGIRPGKLFGDAVFIFTAGPDSIDSKISP